MVPEQRKGEKWASVGAGVCAWMEEGGVVGAGDVRGERGVGDPERRAWR